MAYRKVDEASLTEVADAIRAKSGTMDKMEFPGGFVSTVQAIQTGGGGDDSSFKDVIEGTAVNPTLPSDLTKIRRFAFYGCPNLALTSLPAGVTSIDVNAFYDCTNLALTSLPEGVTNIGASAFQNCPNLALTSLPAGVTNIGGQAFYGCTNLALTSLPEGVTSISNYVFEKCTNLALTSLPEGVTSISTGAFQGCTNLALTELPSGLKGNLDGAFFGAKKLNIKTVPTGITIITNSALKDTGITEFTVPANTMLSGYQPLGANSLLTTVTFEGKPTSITNTAFVGCTNLTTINVPWAEGAVANAPWGATNATINYNYTGE